MVKITNQLATSTTKPSQADHELSQALVLADFHPRILPHIPGGGLCHALSSGTLCIRERLHTGSPTNPGDFPQIEILGLGKLVHSLWIKCWVYILMSPYFDYIAIFDLYADIDSQGLNLFHSCQSFFCVCFWWETLLHLTGCACLALSDKAKASEMLYGLLATTCVFLLGNALRLGCSERVDIYPLVLYIAMETCGV